MKSASREELLDAVVRTAQGEPVFTPGLAGLVLGEYRRLSAAPAPRSGPAVPRLTERETEVLRLVAKGLSYKEIAERLVLSHRTVQNHVQNTLNKLQLHNRVELVRYAIEQGLDDACTDRRRTDDEAALVGVPALGAVDGTAPAAVRRSRASGSAPAGSKRRSSRQVEASSSVDDQTPVPSPARKAAPSAVVSSTSGRSTAMPRASACSWSSSPLAAAPPSTRRVVMRGSELDDVAHLERDRLQGRAHQVGPGPVDDQTPVPRPARNAAPSPVVSSTVRPLDRPSRACPPAAAAAGRSPPRRRRPAGW